MIFQKEKDFLGIFGTRGNFGEIGEITESSRVMFQSVASFRNEGGEEGVLLLMTLIFQFSRSFPAFPCLESLQHKGFSHFRYQIPFAWYMSPRGFPLILATIYTMPYTLPA